MTLEEIRAELDAFIEYPDDSEKRYVTTASALIFAGVIAEMAAQREREACAAICDELESFWSAEKDVALLNGDVALSNASSGEPRAARAIAQAIRVRGEK